ARILDVRDDADAAKQRALSRGVDDHVGHEAGEIDVIGADREQHQIELAVGLAALSGAERRAQFRNLAIDGDMTGRLVRRTFAGTLAAEQAVGNGRTGASERKISHSDVGILHGKRQRGARLIAVKRAVAGRIEPHRTMALPIRECAWCFAGAPAFVAGAARPVILPPRRPQIIAEAEALVGERDRAVRITLAGGDAVAEAGNQDISHLDHSGDALRSFLSAGDVDGGDGLGTIADTKVDGFGAVEGRLLWRAVAIVERPGAGRSHRHRAGKVNGDRMIDRREIAFLDVVARAGLADPAELIDAEPLHHVARPTPTLALQLERVFGGENTAVAQRLDVELKIAFLAEQAEAVAYLPGDLHRRGIDVRTLGVRRRHRRHRQRAHDERSGKDGAERKTKHGAFENQDGAEMRGPAPDPIDVTFSLANSGAS